MLCFCFRWIHDWPTLWNLLHYFLPNFLSTQARLFLDWKHSQICYKPSTYVSKRYIFLFFLRDVSGKWLITSTHSSIADTAWETPTMGNYWRAKLLLVIGKYQKINFSLWSKKYHSHYLYDLLTGSVACNTIKP